MPEGPLNTPTGQEAAAPGRRQKVLLLVLGLLLLAGIVVGGLLLGVRSRLPSGVVGPPGRPYRPPPVAYEGDSTGLEHTVVVPTLDTPMPPGKNVIWCSSFQVAWNHLRDDVIKAPVQLANAQEVADRLNRAPQSEADLPEGSYYARAGFVKDGIVGSIQKEMARRFPSVTMPQFDVSPDAIVAYAYLAAGVKFTIPFFDSDGPLTFQGSTGTQTAVSAFGIRPEDRYAYHGLRQQVEVLYVGAPPWKEPQTKKEPQTEEEIIQAEAERIRYVMSRGGWYVPPEFAIDPCKDSSPAQIVLATVSPKDTLAETLAGLEGKIRGWPSGPDEYHERSLLVNEILLVPDVFYRIRHQFRELEGKDKLVLNQGFAGFWIAGASQSVDFRLDRSGAELTSEAEVEVLPAATPRMPDYVFNRPFLVYMKKRGAEHPFFVMWVDNAELLCAYEGGVQGEAAALRGEPNGR